MPQRRATKPKMGDRVDVLENKVDEMKIAMDNWGEQMKQHGALLAEISKHLGLRGTSEPRESNATNPPVGDSSVEASSMNESRLAGKKVKLPLFDGDDPVAWITRAEIYFDVQQTPDEMRVKLARLSMEGPTIHWFNLLMETEDFLSWEKLKKSLIARYGGRRLENPFEELATLKQSGSVEEFVEAFELLSSQVGRLPEEQY
ncbi:pentatricopeptide repeat-containing protein, partial [Trifolium pratense]